MTEPLSIPNLESRSSLHDTPGERHPPLSMGSWKPHSPCEVGLKVAAPGTGLGPVHLDSPVDRWPTCADEQTQCLPVLPQGRKSPVSVHVCPLHLPGMSRSLSLGSSVKPAPSLAETSGAKEPKTVHEGTLPTAVGS